MWSLAENRATWSDRCGHVVVYPESPWLGVRASVEPHGGGWLRGEFTTWRVSPPCVPDIYIRGDDLIASYPQSRSDELTAQLQWSARKWSDASLGIDLLVSVQTALLDSNPQFVVGATLPPATWYHWQTENEASTRLTPSAALWTHPTTCAAVIVARFAVGPSWFLMIHPEDLPAEHRFARSDSAPWITPVWATLFTERLEKGVIRRARVRSGWTPPADEALVIRERFDELLQQPLPLTT